MLNCNHLMLDIETLDNGPQSAVLAIGARVFTVEHGPSKGFEVFINQLAARDLGTTSQETMTWWSKQKTMEQVFSGKTAPATAVFMFKTFCEDQKVKYVWANAPSFDCVILRHLFKQVGIKFPFHYRDERCCRTLFALGRELNVDLAGAWEGKQAHLPGDDAAAQAIAASRILQAVISSPSTLAGLGSGPRLVAPSPPAPDSGKTDQHSAR
jgi:hypothetical protein